jgi:hypothetical protein
MNAITTPPDGLLVYNKNLKSIYQYKESSSIWLPIRSDSSDWFLDTVSKKLYLKYGLSNEDSVYYHTTKKKFLFTDTRFYTTSTGSKFNLDEGNSDKYIFKVTASKFSANLYSVFEVDNDTIAISHPFETLYVGARGDVTVTPSALQKIGQITGLQSVTSFGGKDSINTVIGFTNATTTRGKGNIDLLQGISNTVSIRDSSKTIGSLIGTQTFLSYSSPLNTPRVSFLAGYQLNISSAFVNKVDGPAYGLTMGNITASATNSNFAINTNKGVNHFGDSTLITDGIFSKPRMVLDINSTSAMIMPTGTTTQRPTATYTGMLRYNIDNATPEAYTGTTWVNLKSPILSTSGLIDPPFITNNSTAAVNYGFTGCAVGNTVTISPSTTLPSGLVIAYAYVSSANVITVGFANFSGSSMDPAATTYYIKVIQ